MRQLNYNHLHYFYTVAREGSIVKAAEILNVTAQTVSGQLATFEKQLGFELFDRRGKRLLLNAHGKTTYSHAEEIFNKGEILLNIFKAAEHGHIEEFVVGITDVIPKTLTLDFVRGIMVQPNATRFIFKEGDFDSLLGELAVNKIDMIISDQPVISGTSVKAFSHLIGETGISFFSKPEHSYLADNFPNSLHQSALLVPTNKARLKSTLTAWFESNELFPNIVAEFDDSALLKLFGSKGFGVFCTPSIIKSDVEQQYQVKCIGETLDISESYYLVVSNNRKDHSLITQFIEQGKSLFN